MKNIIKKERVQLSERGAAKAPASRQRKADPCVRLVRTEGRVSAIEVTCSCGQVSLLELEYDAEPPQP